ncbi:MAG TPA: ABC transporter permease [Puia sp.]|jgi:putative ABC transport system permease protein
MFRNYLKTTLRNLWKHKTFTAINIIGLSVGMAACLLILQYVNFELSYDQFNRNVGDLYRVYNDRYQNGQLIQHGTITYSAIGKALQNDYPEVIDHARIEPFGDQIITSGNKKFGDQPVIAVDNSFLSMFSYPLMAGDQQTALKEPYTVVLTERAAKRYFGVQGNDVASVLGKAIVMGNDSMPYKITGVCRDVPENSHLQFDMLASYVSLLAGKYPFREADYNFTQSDFWHYIQLRPGTDYKKLEAKLDAFSQKYFQGNKVSGSVEKFYLQPLARAHLYSDFEYEIGKTGSATVVWGLLIIALFIIVIAWVNYINLSTARSAERAKEVGVRKVIGAGKGQLVRQFLLESLLINSIALVLAIVLMTILQPAFNILIGHKLSLSFLFQKSVGGYSITAGLLALMGTGIFISGFYPAFILSSFKPILVLKGRFSTSKSGILLRKALVVGQFAITVALIIGSFVVYKQIRFMNRQELGMNINEVLMIKPPSLTQFDSTFIDRENTFMRQLKNTPGVLGAATSWSPMGGETGRSFDIRRADQDNTTHFTMRQNGISFGFLDLYKIRLLAGRDYTYTDFNPDFGKLHNIIVNESATKLLGFSSPQQAIGKTILRGNKKWDIIGVINNYHQKSLRYSVEPTLLMPAYSTNGNISVKVNTKDLPSTVAGIKKSFDSFFPGNYFDYYFLDAKYKEQYANDQLFGKAFSIFAGFAIFIACLGLLGLSLFATMQRTKEIGVRKVLGAPIGSIVILLSREFVQLVLLANLIAFPLAGWLMSQWLRGFAYHTQISWWIFALSGLAALVIALGTVSGQSVRAALTNPVKSLRSE